MNKTVKLANLFILLIIFLSSCASPQGLMRTWSSPKDFDRQFKNLMVIGLVNNVAIRSDVEYSVVEAARNDGISAAKGINMFPPELGKPFEDIERVKERLREKNFDGIITVALIDVKEPRYNQPTSVYEPLVYYDRFRNYYYRTYDLVYKPGYISMGTSYFIETNFYELKDGFLVWSGRSGLFTPDTMDASLKRYAKGLFKELKLENIIVNE